MSVFALLLTPLFGFLMVALYRISVGSFKKQLVLFGKGVSVFIPAYVLVVVLRRLVSQSYRPAKLYFFTFFEEHFVFYVVLIGGFVAFWGLANLYRIKILDFVSFSAGFYSVAALQAILENHGTLGEYHLFLLPIVRVAMIVLAALFAVKYLNAFGVFRVLYALFLILLPFLVSLFSALHHTNYRTVASVLMVMLLPAALTAWHFLRE
jgi:hypothetical protein